MYIKKICIENFRLFLSGKTFSIDDIYQPDGGTTGSGLNVFVGENGSGKSALLEAFVLPLLEYKSDEFKISDMNEPLNKTKIEVHAHADFKVAGTMPKSSFEAKGFLFEAGIRGKSNKAYLSSKIVNDQKFLKSDPTKPKDGSPDLRVRVNNPFRGKRFSENDILYLDRNRLYQTRTGNFNSTRFDRLMEDFDYQYLKNSPTPIPNLNTDLDNRIKVGKVENKLLQEAIAKFKEFSGSEIRLEFLDNYSPFKSSFFAETKPNNQHIPLNNLGSGYEMIFALIYSFYLAQQSGKQLIILIDEPELHLHPRLQSKFVDLLLEFSKFSQIIVTSHSPLLVKQVSSHSHTKIRVLEKDGGAISEIQPNLLPFDSANEINFSAFNLATEEYHNELFEELKDRHGPTKTIKQFDQDFFVTTHGEQANSLWKGNPNEVSVHTFVRNQIHHQKENGKADYQTLKSSIEKMRTLM